MANREREESPDDAHVPIKVSFVILSGCSAATLKRAILLEAWSSGSVKKQLALLWIWSRR